MCGPVMPGGVMPGDGAGPRIDGMVGWPWPIGAVGRAAGIIPGGVMPVCMEPGGGGGGATRVSIGLNGAGCDGPA